MEKHQEITRPIPPLREPGRPVPPLPEEQRCETDELPPFPISPPPMPWPRVFPGL